jgi:uncharacterized protein (DUF2249 family)
MSEIRELDVRSLPPRERHPKIMQLFDTLNPGEKFQLINDHNPKPLYYFFLHERANQFCWGYVEEGPQVWRVDISRTA